MAIFGLQIDIDEFLEALRIELPEIYGNRS